MGNTPNPNFIDKLWNWLCYLFDQGFSNWLKGIFETIISIFSLLVKEFLNILDYVTNKLLYIFGKTYESRAFKLGSGYFFGLCFYSYSIYVAYNSNSPEIMILSCIIGGLVGWTLGITISPTNKKEKKRFEDWAKTVSTLLSGFVLAQYNTFFSSIQTKSGLQNDEFLIMIFLFIVCFFVGLLSTFATREYAASEEEKVIEQRGKLIEEITEKLEELNEMGVSHISQDVANNVPSMRNGTTNDHVDNQPIES